MKAIAIAGFALVALGFVGFAASEKARFIAGGALVNLGYRMQDHLETFNFDDAAPLSPQAVLTEMLEQNALASSVRERFPRTAHHPLVALVACMDARLDTLDLVGDTRKWYYVIRTAGSVMAEKEMEMLELAVTNGVKVIAFFRHTDCAAERVAADTESRKHFPALAAAVDSRAEHLRAFLARPEIAKRIEEGDLIVREMTIDTQTEHVDDAPDAEGLVQAGVLAH